MTVCDRVCLGVVSISGLLPRDRDQSPLVDETPVEGLYDT